MHGTCPTQPARFTLEFTLEGPTRTSVRAERTGSGAGPRAGYACPVVPVLPVAPSAGAEAACSSSASANSQNAA